MVEEISAELLKLVRKQLASAGGKARAKKYDAKTLSKWAKLGGRPRNPEPDEPKQQKKGRSK